MWDEDDEAVDQNGRGEGRVETTAIALMEIC